MPTAPTLELSGFVLGAPDARALAAFYRRLLGWQVRDDQPEWVVLRGPAGGPTLAFQAEERFEPPVWPADGEHQQMMMHLDIRVDDLEAAVAHAVDCGARVADFQPQDHVRVCLDPAGHPFCLYVE
ncbi:VOC family protein [Jiangella rhizosphaerae]|uniref:VOC family protein n=1 Tax=Jiangella rhizosphaerae TaxID=2293569 RepID=A0A418KQD9_9ACTN|nr:VOC family protein [Jiangella rhizosphaerae]RIQ22538.1 VOC family protein [Jiangella rhizosphaerae]